MSPTWPPAKYDPNQLVPPEVLDAEIEAFKKDVDRTLLRENLKLSPDQRAQRATSVARFSALIQEAGRKIRGETKRPSPASKA